MSDLFFDDDLDGRRGHALRRASVRQWNKGITEDSMPAAQLETRDVQVQQVNGHGFKSTDGDWYNASKFARPEDVVLPKPGERVQVSLDRSGFVRKIASATLPTTAPEPTPQPPVVEAATVAAHIQQDDKGTAITRMNVLTTAAAILASGGRVADPNDVLSLAARLEVWVTR
jgi:hypothetical protein